MLQLKLVAANAALLGKIMLVQLGLEARVDQLREIFGVLGSSHYLHT